MSFLLGFVLGAAIVVVADKYHEQWFLALKELYDRVFRV